MASNYPGSLDSFDTIASDKKTSDAVGGRTHRQMHNDLGDAIEAVQSELGTNPSGSDATVAARLSAIESSHLSGTGSPEGVVTAAPGSTWLQTDATTDVKGWIRWVKATGTGNTGWQVGAEADTGWRSIASWDAAGTVTGTMPPDIVPRTGVAGYIHLRRFGTTVVLAFIAIQLNGPGPNMSAANIAGFRDIGGADQWISMYNGSAWSNPLVCQTAGAGYATWIMPGTTGHFNLRTAWTWQTSDAWPSVLPGSAA